MTARQEGLAKSDGQEGLAKSDGQEGLAKSDGQVMARRGWQRVMASDAVQVGKIMRQSLGGLQEMQ